MDVVGDASLALFAFEESREKRWSELSVGTRILQIYGAFQALVLQQDGVEAIASILGVESRTAKSAVQHVRDLRVRVAGHPLSASVGKEKPRVWGLMRPSTLERDQVNPYEWIDEHGRLRIDTVVYDDILRANTRYTREVLIECAKQIRAIAQRAVPA
jgi:hypothetical protein